MKRSTATGKNRKFVITIFTCTCRVLQKMLSNSRKGSFSFKALKVLSLYSIHFISDSLTFADQAKTFNFPPSVFLCSYGRSSRSQQEPDDSI